MRLTNLKSHRTRFRLFFFSTEFACELQFFCVKSPIKKGIT